MGKALPPEQHCRTADLQLLRNGAVVLPLIAKIARIYSVTKEITLTAAKYGAQLKDITIAELARRGPKKPETEEEKLKASAKTAAVNGTVSISPQQKYWIANISIATDKILQKRPQPWNRPAGSFA